MYETCSIQDFACLAMAASDKLGLEAIKSLHQKLDDDANGNIDLSESDDVSIFSHLNVSIVDLNTWLDINGQLKMLISCIVLKKQAM